MPDRYASFCSFSEAIVGRPSVVKDEGTEENGEAGAPDGAKTGFAAVVSDAGSVT
ncbi:hypothetical protein GCM10027341_27920 [Spirosoma knui]